MSESQDKQPRSERATLMATSWPDSNGLRHTSRISRGHKYDFDEWSENGAIGSIAQIARSSKTSGDLDEPSQRAGGPAYRKDDHARRRLTKQRAC